DADDALLVTLVALDGAADNRVAEEWILGILLGSLEVELGDGGVAYRLPDDALACILYALFDGNLRVHALVDVAVGTRFRGWIDGVDRFPGRRGALGILGLTLAPHLAC